MNPMQIGPVSPGNYQQPNTGNPSVNPAVGVQPNINKNPLNIDGPVPRYEQPDTEPRQTSATVQVGLNPNPLGVTSVPKYQQPDTAARVNPSVGIFIPTTNPMGIEGSPSNYLQPATGNPAESPGVGVATPEEALELTYPLPTYSQPPDPPRNPPESVEFLALPATFSRGGTILSPTAAISVTCWQAPFACTVTAVRGYAVGAGGTTVNAQKNGSLLHLPSDLALSSTGTWLDGGPVENASYAVGDTLQILLTNVVGSPSQICVQVDFTRS